MTDTEIDYDAEIKRAWPLLTAEERAEFWRKVRQLLQERESKEKEARS